MQNKKGWTALMWAAFYGKTDCVRLLLSEAGKQSTKEWRVFPSGMTALMLAAHQNHIEIAELLLPYEQGMTDSKGHTAKWHTDNSPREGDFTQVRKLLENEGSERISPPSNPAEVLKLSDESESLKKELASSKTAREEAEEKLTQLNQEVASFEEQLNKTTEERDAFHKQLEDEKQQDKARNDKLSVEVESLRNQLSSSKNDLDETKKMLSQLSQEVASLKEQLSKTTEALKKELAKQKARVLALERENAQLRTESQNAKNLQAERDDLQRRLKEVEEKNRDLLKNLTEAGKRLI